MKKWYNPCSQRASNLAERKGKERKRRGTGSHHAWTRVPGALGTHTFLYTGSELENNFSAGGGRSSQVPWRLFTNIRDIYWMLPLFYLHGMDKNTSMDSPPNDKVRSWSSQYFVQIKSHITENVGFVDRPAENCLLKTWLSRESY